MNDKYAKEIAKELRLIRIELQKSNTTITAQGIEGVDLSEIGDKLAEPIAGERVTIK